MRRLSLLTAVLVTAATSVAAASSGLGPWGGPVEIDDVPATAT